MACLTLRDRKTMPNHLYQLSTEEMNYTGSYPQIPAKVICYTCDNYTGVEESGTSSGS